MELLDKLSKVARKVEKKTVIHLTADEKKLLAEIEQQHAELEALQAEFEDALEEEDEGLRPAAFKYPVKDEAADNMEVERLAELLKFESLDNKFMIDAGTVFVKMYAGTVIQRVYRGHLGRRKYNVIKGLKWAKEAEETAIIMQAAYRGMVGRREARGYYARKVHEERVVASVQVQRIMRGYRDRRMTKEIQEKVKEIDKKFYMTRGQSEAPLFRKRNNVATADDSPDSSSSNSDDDEETLPTRHPKTGKRVPDAPQYGEKLKETHRHYHHPHTRLPPQDSFDSDSSGSDGGQDDANDAMSAATGIGGRPITAATGTTASSR